VRDKQDDGGPAFPNPGLADSECHFAVDVTGMTLRDYFAAKAMAAFICEPQWSSENGGYSLPIMFAWSIASRSSSIDRCAETAYLVADAMLKARNE
jgi:hypothetical protein